MPQIAGPIIAFATWVGATVGGAVATVTGSIALGGYVSTALYYGTQIAIYAGLSAALTPRVPKGEGASATFKQDRPDARAGYGTYRAGGPLSFWDAKETKAGLVAALHEGRINRFTGVFWLHDDQVAVVGNVVQQLADGRYWTADQRVKLDWRTGLPSETAYQMLIDAFPGKYTSAFRGDGVASLAQLCNHGKIANFSHDYPYGEPKPSAEIEAQRVYDPRDEAQSPADPATWTWTKNAARCFMHYLAWRRGYAFDIGTDGSRTFNAARWTRRFGNTIDFWTAAADVCDGAVDLANGDTTPRYEIGGEHLLSSDESAVIPEFVKSMDGWFTWDGQGGAVVYAGLFTQPTVTLTDGEVKAISIDWGVEIENEVNEIVASFTNPANKYNTSETDPWTDAVALTRAGRPLREDLQLPWVQSNSQARRLAKRRMERHQAAFRGELSVALDLNPSSGKSILGQRFLILDRASGPPSTRGAIIEVTGNITIDLATMTGSFPYISVDPDARDGWVAEDEEGEEPGTGGDPDIEALADPTIDEAHVVFEENGTSDLQARIAAAVTGPDRGDLTWQLQWKRAALLIWSATQTIDVEDGEHPSTTLVSNLVPAGDQIQIRARYQTGGGQFSAWSNIWTVDTSEPVPLASSTSILASTTHFLASAEP
jgi:hypothetical protein